MFNTGTPVMDQLNEDITRGRCRLMNEDQTQYVEEGFEGTVPFTILISSESEETDAERHAEHDPTRLADYAMLKTGTQPFHHEDEWLDFNSHSDGRALQSDLWTSDDQATAERHAMAEAQVEAYATEVQTSIEEFVVLDEDGNLSIDIAVVHGLDCADLVNGSIRKTNRERRPGKTDLV